MDNSDLGIVLRLLELLPIAVSNVLVLQKKNSLQILAKFSIIWLA